MLTADWVCASIVLVASLAVAVACGVLSRRRIAREIERDRAVGELEGATAEFLHAQEIESEAVGGDWFVHRRAVAELGLARGRMERAARAIPRRRNW